MSTSIWPQLGYDVDLRAEHYEDILDQPACADPRRSDWFGACTTRTTRG